MTRKTDISGELAWTEAIHDIPEAGLTRKREASAEDLPQIARALDLLACTRLTATYSIVPTLDARYSLSGTLRADISQTCVVTLEPVESTIQESFEATFWPEKRVPAPVGGAIAIDDEPDPEPIVAGQLAVGRVVFECLAAAIDPFPKQPGAVLDWSADAAGKGDAPTPDSPFAVLANLKPKG